MLESVVRIRISLKAVPDPGFYLNADPNSGFRILDPKNRNNLKIIIFFLFLAFLFYFNG